MLTPGSRLRDFPELADEAYLNTAAECIPPLVVREAVAAYVRDKCLGMNGRERHFGTYEACRSAAARAVGLDRTEIGFCSCSSEAYNLLASAIAPDGDDDVVVSDLDFPAGVTPWLAAGGRFGVRIWRHRGGVLDPANLVPLLSPRTRLVQVSYVSFWNGHRLDWEAVRDTVRRLAPRAVLAVDVTQALGRIAVLCPGADVIVSSTHKWVLGIHGGCIVGVAAARAAELTPRAGGWYHLENAFDADRFERAVSKRGAVAYAVGMPNFAAVYALEAALGYLEAVGVAAIAAHADPLTLRVDEGCRALGLEPLVRHDPRRMSGIVAFQHPQSGRLHERLEAERIRVMHHAGRIRVSVHGTTTTDDVTRFLDVLAAWRRDVR